MSQFTGPTIVQLNHKLGTVTLKQPITYRLGSVYGDEFVSVPKGFTCDMASIPALLRVIWRRNGIHERAAIVHDFLYRKKRLSDVKGRSIDREEADAIFHEALGALGLNKGSAYLMWLAVRLFGGKAWQRS